MVAGPEVELMAENEALPRLLSRREFGTITLAGLPLALAFQKVDSTIKGVQIGVQSYSFRALPSTDDIIKAMVKIGLSSVELMSNHAEAVAGAPAQGGGGAGGRGRGEMTPEQKQEMQKAAQARAEELRKYHGINLDIGHFTAANFDPIPYIEKNYARITNVHLKDRKKNQGDNVVWGTGDTPIKPVLQLLSAKKYTFPANIEYRVSGHRRRCRSRKVLSVLQGRARLDVTR